MTARHLKNPINTFDLNRYSAKKYTVNKLASMPVMVKDIRKIVHEETGYDPYELNKCRDRECVLSRQFFMYFLKKYTKKSFSTIGGFVGKDHSTTMHSITVINNLSDTNPEFKMLLNSIDRRIIEMYRRTN